MRAVILDRDMAENAGVKQRCRGAGRRFLPGQSGNPAGKPKGARNQATLLAEELLDGETEAMVRVAIDLAKQGNVTALRMCLDRIAPPRRDRPVRFAMPEISSAEDAGKALGSIVNAVACAELTPSEAGELSRVLEAYVKVMETSEIERRL